MSLRKKGRAQDTGEEGGRVTTRQRLEEVATSPRTPATQRLDEAGRAVPGVLGEPGLRHLEFGHQAADFREISVVVSGCSALQSFAPVAPGLSG